MDAISLLWLFGAAEGGGGTDVNIGTLIGPIAGTGVVGIFLLMIIFRVKIMPTYIYDEMKSRFDKETAEKEETIADYRRQISELRTMTEQQIIPALVRANQINGEYAQERIEELRRNRERERRDD